MDDKREIRAAEECRERKNGPRFALFHVPHDGQAFPQELMRSVCVPRQVFAAYHEQMRDRHAALLVPDVYRSSRHVCAFGISRLLCDPERFIGPEEEMERYGMGFCYEQAWDGTVIKQVTERLKRDTRVYYDGHHQSMNGFCLRYPRILLLDLHSYHDRIVPAGRAGEDAFPDVCLGTDRRFTPPYLLESARRSFRQFGLTVGIDRPYSGCYIPENVLHAKDREECDLIGIMLEFHRRAYLDGYGEPDGERVRLIRQAILKITEECGAGVVKNGEDGV